LIYHPKLTQAEREKMEEEARDGGTVMKVLTIVPEPDTPEEETDEHKEKNCRPGETNPGKRESPSFH